MGNPNIAVNIWVKVDNETCKLIDYDAGASGLIALIKQIERTFAEKSVG